MNTADHRSLLLFPASQLAPLKLSKALQAIYSRSALCHCGVLFEDSDGQHKVAADQEGCDLDEDVESVCDLLIEKNKHPGLLLGKNRLTPFSLLDEEQRFAQDKDVSAFLKAIQQSNYRAVYYLPLRDLRGNLFISGVMSQKRLLNTIEMRLVHSYCLDAMAKLESLAAAISPEKDILTPRERECLITAAQGHTEKQTARLLSISPFTVHAHLENCKRKLGARNKLSAIVKALHLGEMMPSEIENE